MIEHFGSNISFLANSDRAGHLSLSRSEGAVAGVATPSSVLGSVKARANFSIVGSH